MAERLKRFGLLRFHINRLNKFDEITQFRLKVLAFINILFAFIYPIMAGFFNLLEIKMEDLLIPAATILSVFGIFKTIGEKFVKVINNNFSFSKIFLIMVIFDILMALAISTYFISPKVMIWTDTILATFQIPFFFAYSTALNNYINYFRPEDFTFFQNYRADLNAETNLIGLILASVITFISMDLAIICFIIGMLLLSFYQIKHYKMFKKYDFKYMYRYRKSLRKKNAH